MQVIDNKAIVLKTKRPHLVTESVDKYKILSEKEGVFKIVVRWGLQEAQALVGLKVTGTTSGQESLRLLTTNA